MSKDEQHEQILDPERQIFDNPAADELQYLRQRIQVLEQRLDLLYRWTVGDETGYRYPIPNYALGRKKTHPGIFPEPDYECQGGPRKPQGEP